MENNEIKVADGVAVDFTQVSRPGRTPRRRGAPCVDMSGADVSDCVENDQVVDCEEPVIQEPEIITKACDQETVSEPVAQVVPEIVSSLTPADIARNDMQNIMQTVTQPTAVQVQPTATHDVKVKTFPVHDAVVQVLSIDDTPFLRAEKIQAMADAAKAHAKLFELGVTNNQFLLTNDSRIANVEVCAIEKGRLEAERARTAAQLEIERAEHEAREQVTRMECEARAQMERVCNEAQAQIQQAEHTVQATESCLRNEIKCEVEKAIAEGKKKMWLGIGATVGLMTMLGAILYFIVVGPTM